MTRHRSSSNLIVLAILTATLPSPLRASEAPPSRHVPILNLPHSGTDPAKIAYGKLPKLRGKHAVICPVMLTVGSAGKTQIGMAWPI